MIGVIAEHVKTHRHQLRKHALFIGSGVKIPPGDSQVDQAIQQMAVRWAGDRVADLDEDERPQVAIEMMAEGLAQDHAQRCELLQREMGAGIRPAEGHVRLARLIKDGYYSSVFIAEPDDMLERALRTQHMEPGKDCHLLVAGIDDPNDIKVALEESSRVTVVKCGGDLAQRFLPLSQEELGQVAGQIRQEITECFRLFSVFVAMSTREKPFLDSIPHDGARIFWINTLIPMGDAELYDELKIENPASAEFHVYQPDVTKLLEDRHSSRHLLCREPGSFNEFFAKLHTRLARRRRRRSPGRHDLTVLRGGPYRFLDYFDVEDEDFYFGREDDVKAVLDRVKRAPITVVFGKPAIGKTSLLRAGIMASLKQESEDADKEHEFPWLVVYTRAGDDPVARIRQGVIAAVEDAGFDTNELDDRLECCELIREAARLTGRQVLVLLDQFAEYFVKLGDKVRERFVDTLAATVETCEDEFRLLIAIREDFVGELFELQGRLPSILHNMHRLHDLSREQAEDAILKPAQNFDLQVERSLVRRIVDDLYRDGVEPARLQVVLHSLYESLSPGGRVITERRYDDAGCAKEILDKYLLRAVNQLPANEKRAATAVLVFMASGSELKAAQTLDRIVAQINGDQDLVERLLAHLIDLGLLRPVGKGRQREYELVHEVLADKIQQDFAGKQVMLRDIQDLLTRELSNFEQFGLLASPDELKLIGSVRDDLTIGPEALELIIRSALREQVDHDYWFERVWELHDRKTDFLSVLMRDDEPQVRLHTYEHLGTHLEAKIIRHLVHGLDDELAQVRELATAYLSQLEGHLLSMLENRDLRVRALAARALAHTGARKALRPIIDAFVDQAPVLRDELTNALLEIDETRAFDMVLRSVVGRSGSVWSGAHALGRLSVGEDELQALRRASAQYGRPELLYAQVIALTHRRSFDQAAAVLDEVAEAHVEGYAQEAIAEAEAQLETARTKASAGEDSWMQFGRVQDHGAYTSQQVIPDLELVWQFETKDPVVASPIVHDNTVYIGSRDRSFYAIDTGKGAPRWTFQATDRIEGAAAVSDELVYFGSLDGSVHALEVSTGQQRWRTSLGSAIRSSCVLDQHAIYLGTRLGIFTKLDAATGEVVWQERAPGEISSTAAAHDDIVVVGCWDGSIYARETHAGDEVWHFRCQAAVSSSPSISDRVVYCGSDDRNVYALSLDNGEHLWQSGLGGQVRSSPALSDEYVVVGSIDGKCYALAKDGGRTVWATQTEEEIMSSPAIAGEVVYVGSRDGALYALNLHTGEVLWRHKSAYGIYSSPAIAEQSVFIGFGYYGVAAFRPHLKDTPKQ